jgi:hypothetical protein
MNKQCLGDSVYVEVESNMLKLTTERGDDIASNTIYLELEVFRALEVYVRRALRSEGERL